VPRVLTEIKMIGADNTQFSYEDVGLLSLHVYLFLMTGAIAVHLIREYTKYMKEFEKMMSPHPIMLFAVCT
jgi:hypothetical protein